MIGVNQTCYADSEGNAIRYSRVQQMEGAIGFKGLAIKSVCSGLEIYHLPNQSFKVAAESFLIGNTHHQAEIKIQAQQVTKGICIDCSPALLMEVGASIGLPKTLIQHRFFSDSFVMHTQSWAHSHVGQKLVQLHLCFSSESSSLKGSRLLMAELAESILLDQTWVQEAAMKLQCKRRQTLHAVFPLLLNARAYLLDHVQQPHLIQLAPLAQRAGLSTFHFLRLFKQAFGVAPMQFLLEKRLEAAYHALKQGKKPSDVAFMFGFADATSFHKMFKKKFGITPGMAKI